MLLLYLIGTGRSPYKAMFGCPVRLGVTSVGFLLNETANLNQEEYIEDIDIDNIPNGVQLVSNEQLSETICDSN